MLDLFVNYKLIEIEFSSKMEDLKMELKAEALQLCKMLSKPDS